MPRGSVKVRLTTVTIALVSVPGLAQSAATGVSKPDPVTISAQGDEDGSGKAAKPSAAIPLMRRPLHPEGTRGIQGTAGAASGEVYGAYVPYRGTAGSGAGAGMSSGSTGERETASLDPDAAIVTSVEEHAGELREGTLLRAHIRQSLSTVTTVPGTKFTAELMEAVVKDGRIVLPVGAVMEGRVTEVHGGRRISGAAMLHLEVSDVALPDGTHYMIHAQLIDTDQSAHTSVDREGTLVRRDHPHETLAALSLSTGGAAGGGGGGGGGGGAGIGAGVGAVSWLKQDRQAVLPQDSLLVFSLTAPMPVMPVASGPVSRLERAPAGGHGGLGMVE